MTIQDVIFHAFVAFGSGCTGIAIITALMPFLAWDRKIFEFGFLARAALLAAVFFVAAFLARPQ